MQICSPCQREVRVDHDHVLLPGGCVGVGVQAEPPGDLSGFPIWVKVIEVLRNSKINFKYLET